MATIKEAVETFIDDNCYGMWIVPNGKILEVFHCQDHMNVANGFFMAIDNPVVSGYYYSSDVLARHGWIRVVLPTRRSQLGAIHIEACRNYLTEETKTAILELLSATDYEACLSLVSYKDPMNCTFPERADFCGDRREVMAELLNL